MSEELNHDEVSERELQELDKVVQTVEQLDPRQRKIVYQKLEIYQGELPHPKILKGYNELYPDAAKMIITNGINESEHRRKMEEQYLTAQVKERRLGQWLGFILAIVIVCVGAYLIATGHTVAGSILSGVTALGLIGLFTGSNNKKSS